MANDLLTLEAITREAIKRFRESPPFVSKGNLADYYLQQGLLQQALSLVQGKPATAAPPDAKGPPDMRSALAIIEKAREQRSRMEAKLEAEKAFYEGTRWVYSPEGVEDFLPGPRENLPFPSMPPAYEPVPAPVLTMPSWPPRRELFFEEDEIAPPAEIKALARSNIPFMVAYGHMIIRPEIYGIVCQAR